MSNSFEPPMRSLIVGAVGEMMKSAFSLLDTVFLSLVSKPEGLRALVRVSEERADERNFRKRRIMSDSVKLGFSDGRSAALLRKACPAACAF